MKTFIKYLLTFVVFAALIVAVSPIDTDSRLVFWGYKLTSFLVLALAGNRLSKLCPKK